MNITSNCDLQILKKERKNGYSVNIALLVRWRILGTPKHKAELIDELECIQTQICAFKKKKCHEQVCKTGEKIFLLSKILE